MTPIPPVRPEPAEESPTIPPLIMSLSKDHPKPAE